MDNPSRIYEIPIDLDTGDRRAVVRLGSAQLEDMLRGLPASVCVCIERDCLPMAHRVTTVAQVSA